MTKVGTAREAVPGGRRKHPLREAAEGILLALLIFGILRTGVVQAFRIPSSSMEQTLLVGDYLFITKFEYGARVPLLGGRLPGMRAPRCGDVVVFERDVAEDGGIARLDYIKRIVAVGGQTVELRDKRLFVDGVARQEEFVQHGESTLLAVHDNFGPVTVPAGELFVMGDNRDNSRDSRFWGTVPMAAVHGRAFVRYFSWDAARRQPRWNRILTAVR
jgi:signal peptidase I